MGCGLDKAHLIQIIGLPINDEFGRASINLNGRDDLIFGHIV